MGAAVPLVSLSFKPFLTDRLKTVFHSGYRNSPAQKKQTTSTIIFQLFLSYCVLSSNSKPFSHDRHSAKFIPQCHRHPLKEGASLAARSLAMPGTQRAAASQQPPYHGSSAWLGRLSLKTWQGKKGKHFMRFMFSRQGPLLSDLRPQSSRELKNTIKNKGSCSFAYNEILTFKNTHLERGPGFHLRY